MSQLHSLQKRLGRAEVAQVLTGLEPALHIRGSRGGRATLQHAAIARHVGQGELLPGQPGAATQSRVQGPQDSGPLLGTALCQLEESHVHPAVHQCGESSVTGVGGHQLEEEPRHVGLTLDGTHVLDTELHLQCGDCG